MRKVAALGLAFGLMAGSSAFAGLATFSPSPQDNIPEGTATVSMDLTVTAEVLQNFDGADILLNSDVPFTFAYSDGFKAAANAFVLDPGVPLNQGIRANDLYIAGLATTVGALGTSINVGTVTFDSSALTPGTYSILVSSDADNGISFLGRGGATTEGLTGSGSFTVIPEPASLGLLGLGALGLLRRRFVG